ncbi:MAG: hypothetical protein C4523_20030 [Myxococcales bacterium]|nr:MAG: hypothetical protein C4523_20030 [Myxococcales bacterium]
MNIRTKTIMVLIVLVISIFAFSISQLLAEESYRLPTDDLTIFDVDTRPVFSYGSLRTIDEAISAVEKVISDSFGHMAVGDSTEKYSVYKGKEGALTFFPASGGFWYFKYSLGGEECVDANIKADASAQAIANQAIESLQMFLAENWEYQLDTVTYLKKDGAASLTGAYDVPQNELVAYNFRRSVDGLPFFGDSAYATIFIDRCRKVHGIRMNWRKDVVSVAYVEIDSVESLWGHVNRTVDDRAVHGILHSMSIRCGYYEPPVSEKAISLAPLCRVYQIFDDDEVGLVSFSERLPIVLKQ